jgi:chitodextrinase
MCSSEKFLIQRKGCEMIKLIWLPVIAIALILTGCGGGSPSTTAEDGNDIEAKISKITLSVSKFGEGTIIANQSEMQCSQQLCSSEFEKNQLVKLSAVPATGWTFSHWSGCDTQTGVICEIKTVESTQIHPYFMIDEPPKLYSNVHTLTDLTLDSFISKVGDVLTFGNLATQLQNVKTGDIILSSRGDGFGVRVLSIRSLRDGNIVIDTYPAALDEIIQEGVLVRNIQLIPTSVETADGVVAKLVTQADGSGTILKIKIDGPPKIEGVLNILWNMDNGLRFSPIHGLKELKISANPVITGNLDFTLADKVNDPKWKNVPGIKLKFGSYTLGPVVITPEASLVYKVEVGGKVNLKMTQNFEVRGAVGVQYIPGLGVNGIGDLNATGKILPTGKISAEAGAKISVGPQINLMVYGVAGPTFKTPAYAKASGVLDLSDSVENLAICGASASIGLGVAAEAGGELRLFSKKLGQWDFILFDKMILPDVWRWPSSDALTQNPSCKDTKPPSSPTIARITPSYTKAKIEWGESKDNIKTTGYEVYREGSKIGQTADLEFIDTGLTPGKSYCYRLIAFDAAGNKSSPSSSWAETSGSDYCTKTLNADTEPPTTVLGLKALALSTDRISLNWDRSTDDTGVSSYLISIKSHSLLRSNTNSIEVEKLLPGTEYCFTVYAIDLAGNSSVQSTVICTSTLPEILASYTMYLGCQNREWLIEKMIDLNLSASKDITYTDSAKDYGGTDMIYHLYGSFDADQKSLDAEIRWTFEGSSDIRLDKFVASFVNDDSGEIAMTQVQRTGCDAKVRFVPNS